MVISLTAKGLTTGEVEAHLAEVYSTDISRETISKITDRVLGDMAEWQTRPLIEQVLDQERVDVDKGGLEDAQTEHGELLFIASVGGDLAQRMGRVSAERRFG